MAIIVCGADKSAQNLSQYIKCYITQTIGNDEVTVIGLMSESCELSLRNMWEAPFAGDGIGNSGLLDRVSGLTQVHTQATAKTTLNSQQIWEGAPPPEVPIELHFIAISDARHEVDLPIQYLDMFQAPSLRANIPIGFDGSVGRIPAPARFNVGRKMIASMVISDLSYNLSAPKTNDGYYAYNTVTMNVSTPRMINKYDIPNVLPVS